jgi:hypothetical protein
MSPRELATTPETQPTVEQLAETGDVIVEVVGYEPITPETEASPETLEINADDTGNTVDEMAVEPNLHSGPDLITYSEEVPLADLIAAANTQSFEILAPATTIAATAISAPITQSDTPRRLHIFITRQNRAIQHELVAQGKNL